MGKYRRGRCTVERLMKRLGIEGVSRDSKCWTAISDDALARPADLANRQIVATRSTSPLLPPWSGLVYVPLVIDVFARRIRGWCVSRSLKTGLVLDALDRAL